MGGDLGGTVPPKFEVGGGPCIRPPIFGEVVLLEACENMNRKKREFFCVKYTHFRQEKSDTYVTYEIMSDSRDRGKDRKKLDD